MLCSCINVLAMICAGCGLCACVCVYAVGRFSHEIMMLSCSSMLFLFYYISSDLPPPPLPCTYSLSPSLTHHLPLSLYLSLSLSHYLCILHPLLRLSACKFSFNVCSPGNVPLLLLISWILSYVVCVFLFRSVPRDLDFRMLQLRMDYISIYNM